MKNKSNLTITLYVFTVLSLLYTAYLVFSTYAQLNAYYSTYDVSFFAIAMTVLSSCFTPLLLSVILYALANISDMMYQILKQMKGTEKKTEEKEETVESEKTLEVKEEEVQVNSETE